MQDRPALSVCLLLLVLIPGLFRFNLQAGAREYTPGVLSPHNADAYSLKTFAQFPRWRDLRSDQRAWEVYRYLADPRTGLLPMGMEVLSLPSQVKP